VNLGLGSSDGQLPLASRGARLGARILDGLVESAPIVLFSIIAGVLGAGQRGAEQSGTVGLLIGVGFLAYIGLFIYQIVRLVNTGQTLGKKWLGVKVVRMDGGPVSFGSHFLRGLLLAFAGFIDFIFIFRSDQRCLHDLAAETKVVAV
jgi:uncharacterized RDD family membrane protein YckC